MTKASRRGWNRPGHGTGGSAPMQTTQYANVGPDLSSRLIPLWRRDGSVIAYALIDERDVDVVGAIHWYSNPANRGSRNRTLRAVCWRDGRNVMMHRFILGLARNDPREVDHINGNPLDNRRANLRLVNRSQNKQNLNPRGQANSTSGIRGVSWDTQTQKWRAVATVNRVSYSLGRFASKDRAKEAVVAFRRERMPFSARD